MTVVLPIREMFHELMLDYLDRVPGAEGFAARLGAVVPSTLAAPAGDPVYPFVASQPWRRLASAKSRRLVTAFARHMAEMSWYVPYAGDPAAGAGFGEASGVATRVGPEGPVVSDMLAAGFFHVGPGVTYNDHRHGPEELYLPIAGEAEFWCEEAGWRRAGADDAMIHAPWAWHGMRTGSKPVLILWAWAGPAGLSDTPVLRPSLGGLPLEPVAA